MTSRSRAAASLLRAESVACLAIAIAAGGLAPPVWSDPPPGDYFNLEDFSSEALFATGVTGVGARAMALGGAYTAISDDGTALVFNPAGLAQLVRIETGLGMQHLRDESVHDMFTTSTSAVANHTGLDHLTIAYPFPTYRGSLVVGAGVFRARSNELQSARIDVRPGIDDEFRRTQRDGVYRYVGGMGVDLLESLSFGASLSYWEGQLRDDQYRIINEVANPTFNGIDRLVTEADIDGFSFDLGLLGYVGRSGRLGLAMHSPVWMDIVGDGQFLHQDPNNGPTTSEYLFIDQQPRLPWSVSVGASWAFGWVLLAADLEYAAWDELDLDAPATSPTAPPPGTPPDYDATVNARFGAEFLVPSTPLRLRAGYAYEPEPYQLLLGNPSRLDPDRSTWTFGGGVLLADAFALDLGVALGSFTRIDRDFSGVSEERDQRRIHLSGAYRY